MINHQDVPSQVSSTDNSTKIISVKTPAILRGNVMTKRVLVEAELNSANEFKIKARVYDSLFVSSRRFPSIITCFSAIFWVAGIDEASDTTTFCRE